MRHAAILFGQGRYRGPCRHDPEMAHGQQKARQPEIHRWRELWRLSRAKTRTKTAGREGIGSKACVDIPVLDLAGLKAPTIADLLTRCHRSRSREGLADKMGARHLARWKPMRQALSHGFAARRTRSQALSRITEKVAGYTGLDPALVHKLGGRVDMATFARERERAGAKITSFYDARVSGFDPFPHGASSDYSDPILDAIKTRLRARWRSHRQPSRLAGRCAL